MIKFEKYLILEDPQDFYSKWNEELERWDYSVMKKPLSYPCAFIWYEGWDSRCCGTYCSADFEEVKKAIEKSILEEQERLQKILSRLTVL